MTKVEYWFWLCNVKDLYQDSIARLLEVFHEPEEVYKASEDTILKSRAVDKTRARAIVNSKKDHRSLYRLDKLRADGIRFIYYGSEDYPESLLALPDKPFSLYVKGKLPDPDIPSAGIVGARNCSGYGKEMSLKFSQTLAARGVQIISGLAVGVDSYASKGALESGGKTFAILGSGLDVIYPQQNIELYYQIIMGGGGIISEYPPGTMPLGWHFPHRNRLISAFSDRLLVIEAKKHSGTLSTASHALEQGKDVYALPGRITDPMSEGCNQMIADGAGILLDPDAFLNSWYACLPSGQDAPKSETSVLFASLEARTVYQALDYVPKTLSQIAMECFMEEKDTEILLTEMELTGLAIQVSKDYYTKGT